MHSAGDGAFSSGLNGSASYIRREIEQTDYYLLIVGDRYGTVDPNSGKSFTELEFDYARSLDLPIVALLKEHPGTEPDGRADALADFRARVSGERTVAFWDAELDIQRNTYNSLTSEFGQGPRPGWVRADTPIVPVARVGGLVDFDAAQAFSIEVSGSYVVRSRQQVSATWREIFKSFAGHLHDVTDQDTVAKLIGVAFKQPMMNAEKYTVPTSDMLRLRTQFESYGLVQIDSMRNMAGYPTLWWKVSPAGHQLFLEEFSVRRDNSPGSGHVR